MKGAGLEEIDGREANYVTDVIPRKISRISKNGQFFSGRKIPFRSRMSGSSANSKTNQKEECDSVAGNCGTPPVGKQRELLNEEDEVVSKH